MVFISEIFNINNLNILYNLIHKKIKLNKNVE